MRDAFLATLTSAATADRNIILLTADLGYGVFEKFEQRFAGQYFNVGVAEQNMIGVATGLALEGKRVIVYSIGNFPTLRCLEQIRNDACYHDVNLTLVASGGGFSYGALGMSHHATEDIAILRALPGMTVVAPGTAWEAGEATRALLARSGVGYLRIDKTAADDGSGAIGGVFAIGKARRLREGRDISIFCAGGIVAEALEAAKWLSERGVECRVVSHHTVKPIDQGEVKSAVFETGGIVTVEEHNIDGGFGSAVAECCMDAGLTPRHFRRVGMNNIYSSIVGSQGYLRHRYSMDSSAIAAVVSDLCSGGFKC